MTAILTMTHDELRAYIDARLSEMMTAEIQREVDEEEDRLINGTGAPVVWGKPIRVRADAND